MSQVQAMSKEEVQVRERLRDDFEFYAYSALKIRTKEAKQGRLILNASQRKLHEAVEEQRRKTGKVRIIVLKGRQQGISTYVEGRFYFRTSQHRGMKALIQTHTDKATGNLYGMVQRFHDNCPVAIQPQVGKSNVTELKFDLLDSGYAVATAGGREVGRSDTIQLLHGSEVAFWQNAQMHMGGLMQAVPDKKGTEIFLESTANGMGGPFHDLWRFAVTGRSKYKAVFLPWTLHEEYVLEEPEGHKYSDEWLMYGKAHNLPPERLYWAWSKSAEMGATSGADPDSIFWQFRQEYPATPDEAFQTAGEKCFIKPELVVKARKCKSREAYGPLIMAVDPAGDGADKIGVISRQGDVMGREVCEYWDDTDTMATVGRIGKLIDSFRPAAVFIDVGGLGKGVYDRLNELYPGIARAVNFASKAVGSGPLDAGQYANRRAEMLDALRNWLSRQDVEVSIPDMDQLQTELCAPVWGPKATTYDSNSRLLIEKKQRIIERIGISPGLLDAAMMTFAEPVISQDTMKHYHGQRDVGHQEYSYDPLW